MTLSTFLYTVECLPGISETHLVSVSGRLLVNHQRQQSLTPVEHLLCQVHMKSFNPPHYPGAQAFFPPHCKGRNLRWRAVAWLISGGPEAGSLAELMLNSSVLTVRPDGLAHS